VAIPRGAKWPEAAQLAANPQYSMASVSSLYWAYQYVTVVPAKVSDAPPMWANGS
jgi:hypothetical protein